MRYLRWLLQFTLNLGLNLFLLALILAQASGLAYLMYRFFLSRVGTLAGLSAEPAVLFILLAMGLGGILMITLLAQYQRRIVQNLVPWLYPLWGGQSRRR